MSTRQLKLSPRHEIAKSPTGITGPDQITEGGLPKGWPTLLCGSAGCGKTVLAMEFLVRGATQFNEPGVFMAFEETDHELIENVASMGFDLPALCAHKNLFLDYVRVERSEIEETGEYDLEGKHTATVDFWNLRLYIAGQTSRSLDALENLQTVCEKHLSGKYKIEVVDLLKNPMLAAGDQILAVPTLVRRLPPPLKKIIGDLSNAEKVLVGLDLRPKERTQ